jgi:hypothetical protein
MTRYGFNIRTHTGQRVENISIMAATREDAERRLRQMYQKCEVVDCHTQAVGRQAETLDVASVIERMSASEPLRPLAAPPSVGKPGTH